MARDREPFPSQKMSGKEIVTRTYNDEQKGFAIDDKALSIYLDYLRAGGSIGVLQAEMAYRSNQNMANHMMFFIIEGLIKSGVNIDSAVKCVEKEYEGSSITYPKTELLDNLNKLKSGLSKEEIFKKGYGDDYATPFVMIAIVQALLMVKK